MDDQEALAERFIPGITLSRRYVAEVVQPILDRRFPSLRYAAALIGPGSEVLGFDTPMSTDHHWGPRVMLLLAEEDYPTVAAEIAATLADELPSSFLGYRTNFGPPDEIGVRLLEPISSGTVSHRVETWTVPSFFEQYLEWDTRQSPTTIEWLTFPQHRLRAATAGEVFLDETGELTSARDALAWYPHDVWLYLLAAQWNRIAEEEAFMARCGDVGDELGSTLVAARIVRDIIHLCFLIERVYAPYAKWLGTGFRQLCGGPLLEPILGDAIRGGDWSARQEALSRAYETVAWLHNDLGITEPLESRVRQFHGRPYLVIDAARFAAAIEAQIQDDEVRSLPPRLGSLNQLIDATDKLEDHERRARLRRIYND
ncbi:MAG: DUF4037 domain-containing protein [Vicinamibacterales bacterium]